MSSPTATKTIPSDTPIMYFRLLGGSHIQNDPVTGEEVRYFFNPADRKSPLVYVPSRVDLCERHANKFERLHQHGFSPSGHPTPYDSPPQPTAPTVPTPSSQGPRTEAEYVARLEQLTLQELKAHADSEEVQLRGAGKKEDIIKILRAAFNAH